jgi:hypothetical protein
MKKKSEKSSAKKGFLNTNAVEKMTIQKLKDRNGYDEMRTWLTEIKTLIEAN